MAGVWVKEFQQRGAPHLHFYVALPAAVSEEEMEQLRRRAIEGKRLEAWHGSYRARAMQRWGRWDGEFVPWLRTAWAEVVGTQGVTRNHHGRGVDVRVFFFTEAEENSANRDRVAQYLAAEAAKWRQKSPPDGFVRVGRYWGYWSGSVGFVRDVECLTMDHRVAYELQRRLARWVRLRLRARGVTLQNFERRRDGDGVTAYGLGIGDVRRLVRWSEAAVGRQIERRGTWAPRGYRGAVGGDAAVLPSVVTGTGERVV